MALTGRTLTRHFHIETRQHELFNLDLGEGVPRRMLLFGVVVTLGWVVLLAPVLGMPTSRTFSFYVIPPVCLAVFGFQEDPNQPRRRRLTTWALRARYITTGHRPVIALGSRAAYRSEYVPLGVRVPVERALRRHVPWLLGPEWEATEVDERGPIQAGRSIGLSQTATLYGFDHMSVLRAPKKRGRA